MATGGGLPIATTGTSFTQRQAPGPPSVSQLAVTFHITSTRIEDTLNGLWHCDTTNGARLHVGIYHRPNPPQSELTGLALGHASSEFIAYCHPNFCGSEYKSWLM